jgi:hypothetical protein
MNISTAQVKEIRAELAKLKPVKVTLDGNSSMTVKEAVFALAPTLERMKKRGFDNLEIADKLHEKGIDVKPPTLAKYLNEFRRGKDRKKDTPGQPEATAPVPEKQEPPPQPAPGKTIASPIRAVPPPVRTPGSIGIKPDTPNDEL